MNYLINELNNKYDEVISVPFWKKSVFVVLLIVVFATLTFRLLNLQIINYVPSIQAANKNYSKGTYILPERGVIYDKNLGLLVKNKPVFSLVIDLTAIDRYKNFENFGQVIPQSYKKVLNKYDLVVDDSKFDDFLHSLKLGRDYFEISNFYSQKDFTAISSDLNNISEDGVVKIVPENYREYKGGEEFSPILGYTGFVTEQDLQNDSWYTPNAKIGVMGLESYYEDYLRGEKGTKSNLYTARSNVVKSKTLTEPTPGNSLVTTLDPALQKVAYTSLKKMVDETNSEGGAVVVQNPNTGEVLAMVSYPSFDNNLFSKGISESDYSKYINDERKPMLVRPIASAFPPGSTFKIVTATAGLSENSMNIDTTITDTGVINIGNYAYKTWKTGGHGVINVVAALKESSDIFFYIVAGGHSDYPQIKGLGPYKLYNWAKAFNFGKLTGIDLTGEQPGFVPNPEWKKQVLDEPWYVGNSYHFGIGQGYLTATPLQVNTMINAIANGGTIVKPYIVSKIVDTSTNNVIFEKKPTVLSTLPLKKDDLQAIQKGLLLATSPGGTAYPLFNYKVQVAGKTGTSEFGAKKPDGTYPTHAWYTSYAPFNNPEISVTVFVEGGGGGSDNAVPVAKDVYNEYFKGVETIKN